MKQLKDLTEKEFNNLKNIGMLYEFYPDAPETYEEIKGKNINMLNDNDINLSKLKNILKNYVENIIKNKEYPDDDINHYIYETVLETFYGNNIFEKLNKITN